MNTYGLLGGLFIMAGLGSWAVWERGDAANWHEKFTALQSGYTQAAQQAKDDAQKQEQADLKNLQAQSSAALLSAQAGQKQAQTALQAYQVKLAEASKAKDLPHLCSSVIIPSDLLPGQK